MVAVVPQKYCHFNKRLVDCKLAIHITHNQTDAIRPPDETSDTHATLHFADNTSAEADLIVACDGVKSPLRKAMYKKMGIDMKLQQEKYAEWIAWRGLIPASAYREHTDMDPAYGQMWLGKDRHILVSP